MKKIILHGPALDNLRLFCDAGSELLVSSESEAGHIDAKRADELLEKGAAVTPAEDAENTAAADDGLDRKKLPQLRKIADLEGAPYEGDANRATIMAAIRDKRLHDAKLAEGPAVVAPATPVSD